MTIEAYAVRWSAELDGNSENGAMNKTKKLRIEKKMRRWWRDERAIRNTGRAHPAPKFGVRALSILHPRHPLRLYGRGDERYINRDKARWE